MHSQRFSFGGNYIRQAAYHSSVEYSRQPVPPTLARRSSFTDYSQQAAPSAAQLRTPLSSGADTIDMGINSYCHGSRERHRSCDDSRARDHRS